MWLATILNYGYGDEYVIENDYTPRYIKRP